jgi:hypothetical protein
LKPESKLNALAYFMTDFRFGHGPSVRQRISTSRAFGKYYYFYKKGRRKSVSQLKVVTLLAEVEEYVGKILNEKQLVSNINDLESFLVWHPLASER